VDPIGEVDLVSTVSTSKFDHQFRAVNSTRNFVNKKVDLIEYKVDPSGEVALR
jgi:hypothetical protein